MLMAANSLVNLGISEASFRKDEQPLFFKLLDVGNLIDQIKSGQTGGVFEVEQCYGDFIFLDSGEEVFEAVAGAVGAGVGAIPALEELGGGVGGEGVPEGEEEGGFGRRGLSQNTAAESTNSIEDLVIKITIGCFFMRYFSGKETMTE